MWQRTFQKKINPIFSVLLLPRYHALIFKKIKFDYQILRLMLESFSTNLKSQISKTKKLVCPFYIENYMAISSLTRQWCHQKLEVDFFRERKMILQWRVFFRYYFWCLKVYLFFISCVSLPLISDIDATLKFQKKMILIRLINSIHHTVS